MEKIAKFNAWRAKHKKLIRIMRYYMILYIVGIGSCFANGTYSQNTFFTLEHNNRTVKEIIREIEQSSEFLFFYMDDTMDLSRKVSVKANNEQVEKILDQLFAGTRTQYYISDRQIVISEAKKTEQSAPAPLPQQQLRTITGVVRDEAGTIIGANVVVKGTTNGAVTDIDGKFTLSEVQPGAVLQVSYIGYITQEVPVANQTNLRITIHEDIELLDEIVVVGYGVQKKALVTGATVQVKSEEISNRNTQDVLAALQGQSPGVQISQVSGQPGEDFKVSIRGLGTVGNATPLYIVDGVQTNSLSHISTSDIESIDILKDAASASIYGARAANGVILVTTKQGHVGKTTISYDGYFGWQSMPRLPKLLNAQDYAMIMNEQSINSTGNPIDWSYYGVDLNTIGDGTDWFNELIEKNASSQNHALGITGGSTQGTYAMNLSYSNQEGIFGGSKFSYNERISFRINSNWNLYKDIIRAGESLSFSNMRRRGVRSGGPNSNLLNTAMQATPILPVYDADGNFHQALLWFPDESNPVGAMHYNSLNSSRNNKLLGNIFVEIEPIKKLKFRSVFGLDFNINTYRSYTPIYRLSTTDYESVDAVTQRMQNPYSYSWDNTLTYDFKISDHAFNLLAGMQARRETGEILSVTKRDLIFDDFEHAWINNAMENGANTITVEGAPVTMENLVSYFGRVQYNYKEKYLFNGSIRADASSIFGSNYRTGIFPSFSAGWIITNEPFFGFSKSMMDYLKLRLSWGRNGNNRIDAFAYAATISTTATGYQFGGNDNLNTTNLATYQSRSPNPNVKWESAEQLNIGFDARFLQSRLNVAFDYFNGTTKDWLLQMPIPASFGQESTPYINGGKVLKRGAELGLTWNDNAGDLRYSIGINMDYVKGEVLEIPNSEGIIHGSQNQLFQGMQEMNRVQVGYPIGFFTGWDIDGLFQTEADVQNYVNNGKVVQPKAVPGDVKFVDQNKDGVIDDEDRIFLGNPTPDVTMGFTVTLAYKGFDFYLYNYGHFGHQIAQAYRPMSRHQYNWPSFILDRWTGPGTSNKIPRVTQIDSNENWQKMSPLYIKNGDFWRVATVTLGYNFDNIWKSCPFSQLKLYVSANNLFTFTNYDGMDPEIGYGGSSIWGKGLDVGYYPHSRSFIIGASIKF